MSLWIDTRLNEEEIAFLNHAISHETKKNWNHDLAGNISKSELIEDKDNWFYESVLKNITEKIFYRDWGNYCRYHLEREEPSPKFKMNKFWVNYQKQHEFNPPHQHINAMFSFVVFMKIPTHWKEQHALPISANSTIPSASNFQFLLGQGDGSVQTISFSLCPEDEGRILFFPAWVSHQVFPFYECEEERITISGNIRMIDQIANSHLQAGINRGNR